jgi:hypothetical protein
MTRDYAHGVIHALLIVGVFMALLSSGLTYIGLMTLTSLTVLGCTLLLVWAVAFFVWLLWG